MNRRVGAFVTVGAAGFVLQIAAVATLTWFLGWPAAGATAVGVELAVLHNFFWHQRWTWRDRAPAGTDRLWRLLRFHLTTGVTSIGGNVLFVSVAAQIFNVDPVIANGLAVGAMSIANYLVTDNWVFRRVRTAAVVVALGLVPASGRAADLTTETLAAWKHYVTTTEAALGPAAIHTGVPPEPVGRDTRIPGGIVHEWRGTVFIAGITVTQLVDALTNPGTPPPQEDVIESRVLARAGDTLRVYLKVVRTAIITVTYDTEHDVAFTRHSSGSATSRSVATRIEELGGNDHGFLWKLNSYWRYTQTEAGVQVDVVSLSLSRSVPSVVRPIVGPIVRRVARESMTRTLDAVRRFGAGLPSRPAAATRSPTE